MGPPELMPAKTLRRMTGVHQTKVHTLRSRPGSSLLYALNAHSLFRFADARFQGVGTECFRNGALVKSGLNGNRLSFMRMAPTVGKRDYLFVAGGGSLFKVDDAGAVTNWGIVAPTTDPTAADNGAGTMAAGTYKYRITFKNSVTGHRSNANPTGVSVTIAASRQVQLTVIPTSSDAQVDQREVWRTLVGGTVYFLLATIADNASTTYNDNTADASVGSTELPTDNAPPNAAYNVTVGPHYGRAFWTAINLTGQKGRVVYSPVSRPESDQGFIDISNDDDPTQTAVIWNGSVWVWTEGKLYQIIGTTEPFTWREVQGAPGTTNPETVCVTPYGILYQSHDGLYLFNGAVARLLGFDAVGLLFRGETLEGVASMLGTAHAYARGEYLLSDNVSTIAINPGDGTWRNVGIACNALYYEDDTGKLIASINNKTVLFEEIGQVTDDGTAISFEIETPAVVTDVKKPGLTQRIYVEANTASQWLTPTLYVDGVAFALPQFRTSSRETVEFPKLVSGRVMSIRLVGSLTAQIEIYGIEIDLDIGVEAITPVPVLGSKEGVVPVTTAQAAA